MGGTSAYKLQQIIDNCEYVLAIELMTAVQAVESNKGLRLSAFTEEIVKAYRQQVSFLEKDRIMSDDIEKSREFLLEHKAEWATRLNLN